MCMPSLVIEQPLEPDPQTGHGFDADARVAMGVVIGDTSTDFDRFGCDSYPSRGPYQSLESVMHDETILTSCPQCTRGFNLSNPEVRLDPPAVLCVHCGKKFLPKAEDLER